MMVAASENPHYAANFGEISRPSLTGPSNVLHSVVVPQILSCDILPSTSGKVETTRLMASGRLFWVNFQYAIAIASWIPWISMVKPVVFVKFGAFPLFASFIFFNPKFDLGLWRPFPSSDKRRNVRSRPTI